MTTIAIQVENIKVDKFNEDNFNNKRRFENVASEVIKVEAILKILIDLCTVNFKMNRSKENLC